MSARVRRTLLATCAVLVAGCVGVLGWLYVDRTESGQDSVWERAGVLLSGDDPRQATRDEVMSQARQFMLRVNTYDPSMLDEEQRMPQYRDLVEEVITPKFQESFEQGVPAAEQTVAAAGVARDAEVFSTGVSLLDPDSARVLVAGSFTNSYPGEDEGERVSDEPAPFRVEVSLVRTDGQWLVDDFVPVTGETEEAP